MSGEAEMEAKQVHLQGEVCDGRGMDPITDTGYGGSTCSMNCKYVPCLLTRFYDNSDTDARGETPGQAVHQGAVYDGRCIDPITDIRY